LAIGTTGFATAMTLLMVIGAASGYALVPAYKGTVKSPNAYISVAGCAVAKGPMPTWNPATGAILAMTSAGAKTCPKSFGSIGSSSYGDAGNGMTVAIPFKIASTGSHSVSTSLSLMLTSSASNSVSACPLMNLWPAGGPPLNTYKSSYCQDGSSRSWYASISVIDMTNVSWYSNYSYADAYNYSSYDNSTSCYNYGTPSCYNYSSAYSYGSAYSYNSPGFASFTWNGGTSWTMWTNGTNMVKTDKYAVVISISDYSDAYAYKYNLAGPWSGSAAAVINMGTLGNGLSVSSVTVT